MENFSASLNQTYQTFVSMQDYIDLSEKEKKAVEKLISALKRRNFFLTFINKVAKYRNKIEVIELSRRRFNIEKMIKNFHETANSTATKLTNVYKRDVEKNWSINTCDLFIKNLMDKTARTKEEHQVVDLYKKLDSKLKPFEDIMIKQTIINLKAKITN